MDAGDSETGPVQGARRPWGALVLVGAVGLVVGVAGALWLVMSAWRTFTAEEVALPPVQVHVVAVREATLHARVSGYGAVRAEPARAGAPAAAARVSPLVAALVQEVRCVEGDHVEAGQPLFVLDARLDDAQIGKARAVVVYAEGAAARERALMAQANSSPQRVEAAEQALQAAQGDLAVATARRSYTQVSAPISGTVMQVGAVVGAVVDGTTVLAEIANLERVLVEARIPSQQAGRVAVGDLAALIQGGVEGASLVGSVRFVSPAVDARTDTVLVRVSVPDAQLRIGEFVKVEVLAETHAGVLVVPEVAVVTGPAGPGVSVLTGTEARRVPVVVGLSEAGLVEVAGEGLSAGVQVVSTEAYGLPDVVQVDVLAVTP